MPMKFFLPALFFLFTSSTVQSLENNATSTQEGQVVKFSGFECAEDAKSIIPLLGRGDDFPNFVAQDIEMSLKTQSQHAQVLAVQCTADVQRKVFTRSLDIEGEQQEVITSLEIVIPLNIVVADGTQTTQLAIEQIYKTTNLEQPNARKTVQTFKVLSQQIM